MKMFIDETHHSKKCFVFTLFFSDSAKTTSSIEKTPENVNSPPLQPKNIDPTNVAPATSVQQNNLQQQLQTTSQQQPNTTPATTTNNSPQTQQSPCSNPQSSPLMPQSPFQAPSTSFFPSPHQVCLFYFKLHKQL